jgi:hypothetical protein
MMGVLQAKVRSLKNNRARPEKKKKKKKVTLKNLRFRCPSSSWYLRPNNCSNQNTTHPRSNLFSSRKRKSRKVEMQGLVVVGSKLSSSFLSGLMPAVLAERGATEFVAGWDSSWELAGAASLGLIVLPMIFPAHLSFSSSSSWIVRDASVALLLVSLALVVVPTSALVSSLLPYLFFVCHLALFLMAQFASAAALKSGVPLSRHRLLGTVVSQLLVVLFLLIPSLSTPVVLFAVALVGCFLVTLGAVDPEGTTKATEESTGGQDYLRVSLASAVAFLVIAAIGLNGEQILDASFKLSLRSAQLAGRKGPIVLQHLITAFARFAAFKSGTISHGVLIVLWGVVQLVRLWIVGADADLSGNLYVVGGLIMLDKLRFVVVLALFFSRTLKDMLGRWAKLLWKLLFCFVFHKVLAALSLLSLCLPCCNRWRI